MQEEGMTTVRGVPRGCRPGLGRLLFGCSTILPLCLATSAQIPLAQTEFGREFFVTGEVRKKEIGIFLRLVETSEVPGNACWGWAELDGQQ